MCACNGLIGKKKITTLTVVGEFIALCGRVLKTIAFNFFIFLLGISLGYSYVAIRVHIAAKSSAKHSYIQLLEDDLQMQRKLDESIDNTLKLLKFKIAHDEYSECESNIGKILIKKH